MVVIDAILVKGNGPLQGEVAISGSKNAALPILTAAILFHDPVSIDNVPELRDITTLLNLLSLLGVRSVRRGKRIVLDASGPLSHEAPYDLVRKMRASIYVLGPLLARVGEARRRSLRRARLCCRESAPGRFARWDDPLRDLQRRSDVQRAARLRDRERREYDRERRDRARGGLTRRVLGRVRRSD